MKKTKAKEAALCSVHVFSEKSLVQGMLPFTPLNTLSRCKLTRSVFTSSSHENEIKVFVLFVSKKKNRRKKILTVFMFKNIHSNVSAQ